VRGSGKSHDEKGRGERRNARVVEDQTKQRRGHAECERCKSWPYQLKDRAHECQSAEKLKVAQFDNRFAQPADRPVKAFRTREFERRRVDDHEAQIECVTEYGKAEHDQKISLARRRQKKAHAE
jgi:hypothetical protein